MTKNRPRRLVEEARDAARKVLTERRTTLGRLAERLMSEETIEGVELDRMLEAAQPKIAVASAQQ